VTETLRDIAFFDPTTGYGVFVKQGASLCRDLVGHTTDGGAEFGSLVSVTSWSCSGDAPVSSLAFDDHGDGFLYGPELFVTHDGGTSWASSPQPGVVVVVEALGLSVWMMEADCPPAGQSSTKGCPLQLLQSANGGRSWKSSPSEPPGTTAPDYGGGLVEESAQSQTWLVRLNQSSAYVLSNPIANSSALPNDAPLWFTENGGTS
jgi:hypothetical protein